MTHPNESSAAAPISIEEKAEAFADFLDGDIDEDGEPDEGEPDGEDESEDAEDEADEAAEDEGDDDEDLEEGEEGETTAKATPPPHSWKADAKKLFSQLPPQLQAQVAEREAQREQFIQAKANETAAAKRSAQIEANAVFAAEQRGYASELARYASALSPQRPDPQLLRVDPTAFYSQMAEYEALTAHQQEMLEKSERASKEADARAEAVAAAQMEAEMAVLAEKVPAWSDAEVRKALLTEVTAVGAELGYTAESMKDMSAHDILALSKVAKWKADAAAYAKLQKSKKSKVTSASTPPAKVNRPGVASDTARSPQTKSQRAWQKVKASKSRLGQAEAFADFLEVGGVKI